MYASMREHIVSLRACHNSSLSSIILLTSVYSYVANIKHYIIVILYYLFTVQCTVLLGPIMFECPFFDGF